jgi:hypothetical protein
VHAITSRFNEASQSFTMIVSSSDEEVTIGTLLPHQSHPKPANQALLSTDECPPRLTMIRIYLYTQG